MSLPITLMVDDPAPLINVYWWHVRMKGGMGHPDGRPVAREVPVEFLHRFGELIARWGVRGKFSVLPYPAGLGPITEGWSGCDRRAMREWIETVRTAIVPQMDITPEILTHARALDLEDMTLLSEDESEWSQRQSAETLTPYIAYALHLLREVGLTATGVTSPWMFGYRVEDEYRQAIREAMRRVNGLTQSWYFLHIRAQDDEFQSRVVYRRGDEYLVSICPQVDDYLWAVMESLAEGPEFVGRVADRFITADGKRGRLVELFAAGTPIVFFTHWQCLFCDGREVGLQVLDEVCRRIDAVWGRQVRWLKCSELAAEIAAGIDWTNSP